MWPAVIRLLGKAALSGGKLAGKGARVAGKGGVRLAGSKVANE